MKEKEMTADAFKISGFTKLSLKIDGLILVVLVIAEVSIAFYLLGLAEYDLSYRMLDGGDFSSVVFGAKLISQNGWFWFTDRLAAPYSWTSLFFLSNLLDNANQLIELIISRFVHDPFSIVECLYLVYIGLAGMAAYCVLRIVGSNRLMAICGSAAYGWAPFLFLRMSHLCLCTIYTIPFSVLLCLWLASGKEVLSRDNTWKQNAMGLLAMLWISNSSGGYYQFFTCALLVILMIMMVIKKRNIAACLSALKAIGLIVLFSAIAVLPYFFYCDEGTGTVRSLADAEIYGLKITQLFVPIYSHGVQFLENFIESYNNQMPLVNENQSSYLGIMGGIGFVLAILSLFASNRFPGDDTLFVISRLVIFSVLLGVVGGIGSIISVLIGGFIRGFNRISVFILFLSIAFLAILVSKRQRDARRSHDGILNKFAMAVLVVVLLFSSVLQIGGHLGMSEEGKRYNENYKNFVQEVEESEQKNAAILQLPYIPYPESDKTGSMGSYSHINAFIFSDSLRWSFGAVKGSQDAEMIMELSKLQGNLLVQAAKEMGYSGIMIDLDGYGSEEGLALMQDLDGVCQGNRVESSDGQLIYYHL